MESITTHSTEETRKCGISIAQKIRPGSLLAFTGDLGAGKTTLIQGILEGLRAERPYVSPTFVLMKQYDLKMKSPTGIARVYHADAYRVGAQDFMRLGFDEWLSDPEGLVLLEWPERVADILPEQKMNVKLRSISEGEREIFIVDN